MTEFSNSFNQTQQGLIAAEALARAFGQKAPYLRGFDFETTGFIWKDEKVQIEVSEALGSGMRVTVYAPNSSTTSEFGSPAVNRTKNGKIIRCHGDFNNVIGHIASVLAEKLGCLAESLPEKRVNQDI